MLRKIILAVWAVCCVMGVSAKEPGNAVVSPNPWVLTQPATITINVDFAGDHWANDEDVYLFAWGITPYETVGFMQWGDALQNKFKMSGQDGTYTISVSNAVDFFNIPDDKAVNITTMGLIARTQVAQTEDFLVNVSYMPETLYSGGKGTYDEPYIISNKADFDKLAATPKHWTADCFFEMDADITIGATSGIGTTANPFRGTFDGKGHTINGAELCVEGIGSATGIFPAIDGATITRLGVKDGIVTGATDCGALVGRALSGHISQCFSTGNVSASSICSGGLVGNNIGAVIEDCYSHATINSTSQAAGGLVGRNSGTIRRCYASGFVAARDYAGGCIGANYGNVEASVAINTGIAVADEALYGGLFGGNANRENISTATYAWAVMPGAAPNGFHSTDHDLDLRLENTYSTILGWDFSKVWSWRTQGENAYALLQGFEGQKLPQNAEFFSTSTAIDDTKCEDSDTELRIYAIDGTLVAVGSYCSAIKGLRAGIYICQAGAYSDIHTSKIVVK